MTVNRDSSRTVEYKFTIDPQYKINEEPINANFDGMGEWSKKMGDLVNNGWRGNNCCF